MKHSDFQIGKGFYTLTRKWICTDIGTRTIIALQAVTFDKDKGPPFTYSETLFDEYDIQGCTLDPQEE